MSRQIAVVTATPEMLDVVRARANEIGLSRDALDELAELARGHAAKLLSAVPCKGLGLTVMWGLVEAVGLKVALVEDPEAMARISEFVRTRNESQVRGGGIRSAARIAKKERLQRIFNDPKYFNKLARKGGRARARSMTKDERRRAARKAIMVRWRRVREERKRVRVAPPTIKEVPVAQ